MYNKNIFIIKNQIEYELIVYALDNIVNSVKNKCTFYC